MLITPYVPPLGYVQQVDAEIVAYGEEARLLTQHGDMQKAQLMLTKKKLAEKEVQAHTGIPIDWSLHQSAN